MQATVLLALKGHTVPQWTLVLALLALKDKLLHVKELMRTHIVMVYFYLTVNSNMIFINALEYSLRLLPPGTKLGQGNIFTGI